MSRSWQALKTINACTLNTVSDATPQKKDSDLSFHVEIHIRASFFHRGSIETRASTNVRAGTSPVY